MQSAKAKPLQSLQRRSLQRRNLYRFFPHTYQQSSYFKFVEKPVDKPRKGFAFAESLQNPLQNPLQNSQRYIEELPAKLTDKLARLRLDFRIKFYCALKVLNCLGISSKL